MTKNYTPISKLFNVKLLSVSHLVFLTGSVVNGSKKPFIGFLIAHVACKPFVTLTGDQNRCELLITDQIKMT